MTPERWRQITGIFHAALARDPGRRDAFLADACAADPALRGEVYRARDPKLGRDVAIKVLPPLFTLDPARLARFEREARLLASLNHPHIGAIYGVEDADGVRGLVLELVEGLTLADRLAAGPLAVDEALPIAHQIAEALEAAHEKGIVHRDLKAANMSPEQARGKVVDKRADIWSFGCVLYEMLTGRAAFPGETMSDTIAAILEREPGWNALPSATPTHVRHVLTR